jgi:NADH-quinone oxidoreductase subunit L
LALFLGAIGKSAQFPFHAWLPDAMTGTTPVSALFHAATMVPAGLYLFIRMHPIFIDPEVRTLVGCIGGTTAIGAALCAAAQTNLKRVLAYSTLSQLGIMWMGCAAFALYGTLVHLFAHAVTKALLFLAAGGAILVADGEEEMSAICAHRSHNQWVRRSFFIGALALTGIPPFLPFFSKHLILEGEYGGTWFFLFSATLLASLLTGFYLARSYIETFHTPSPSSESPLPRSMQFPISLLVAGACVGGMLLLSPFLPALLSSLVQALPSGGEEHWFDWIGWFALIPALGMLGIGLSKLRHLPDDLASFLRRGFGYDQWIERGIVRPLQRAAHRVSALDEKLYPLQVTPLLSFLKQLLNKIPQLENGQVRVYASWMILGCAFFLIYILTL